MLKSMWRRCWQRQSIIITSGGGESSVASAIVVARNSGTSRGRASAGVLGSIRYVHVVAALSAGGLGLGALSLSAYAASSSSSSSAASAAFASRFGGGPSDEFPSRRCSAAATATTTTTPMIGTGAPSFADFLSRLPARIGEAGKDGATDVRVFMGNEAGDADSIISSLALAYVRSSRRPRRRQPQIPVVSIPREDMKLRRDVTSLLEICGVEVDGLLYVDDTPVAERLLASGGDVDVSLTLTDHNRIRPDLTHLSSNVAEIVDHHEDGGDHPDVTGSARNVAFDDGHALVGSACTLVAEELLRCQTSTAVDGSSGDETVRQSGESREYYDPAVALALLGTILLDTQNMSPETKRGTERDRMAIDGLLGRTSWGLLSERGAGDVSMSPPFPLGEVPDRAALFDWLQGAKFDPIFWRDMSVRDCLRIDYKLFEFRKASESESNSDISTFGISSVLVPLSELVSKDGFCEGAKAYIDEQRKNDDGDGRKFRLLAVMSLVVDDDGGEPPRRELMLLGDDEMTVESMSDYLLCGGDEASTLRLSPTEGLNGICGAGGEGSDHLVVRAFRQGNVRASRKQVAPIMSRHPPMSRGTACL